MESQASAAPTTGMPLSRCVPTVDLSHHAFNLTDCVWQRWPSFCPQESDRLPRSGGPATCCHADPEARCLPIEPLPLSDWWLV